VLINMLEDRYQRHKFSLRRIPDARKVRRAIETTFKARAANCRVVIIIPTLPTLFEQSNDNFARRSKIHRSSLDRRVA